MRTRSCDAIRQTKPIQEPSEADLATASSSSANSEAVEVEETPKPEPRIPAIVITQAVSNDKLSLLKSAVANCWFKFQAKSVHLLTKTAADHAKAVEVVKTFAQGFTRQPRRPKPLQLLASNLPNVPLNEIKEAFAHENIPALDIRMVWSSGSTCKIAVDFDKSNYTLEKVAEEFPSILYVVVRWDQSGRQKIQ
jgi:hypothetical protein